jgi:hypothetical protein
MVAWKLHSADARDAFRAALPVDNATWDRARGWVVSQAVAILAYYTPENNPEVYARRRLVRGFGDGVLSRVSERRALMSCACRRISGGRVAVEMVNKTAKMPAAQASAASRNVLRRAVLEERARPRR